MLNVFLRNVGARPELLILTLMVMIIAMLIIPLPTVLVDFLIGLNIVISLLVFMGSFYIERILSFSTFPALLLLTTLFRLALSISTSRLILSQADAGEIIASFGEFVIGESLVVGFVIFSIVTIVQFIVITKGSERVAEVAARFSLDGMPGKQMSIDGDLKAGAITAEEAKEKRSVLERESQLYGSFDGAMKFIRAELQRSTDEKSEVAYTTTHRERISHWRRCSMNSVTSRPRSPIRPMTNTSASV